MYFDAPQDHSPIISDAPMRIVLSLNGLAVLGFGIFPGMLMAICAYSVALSL
jgi:NADH-quinone oxidoreductase subunit N